MSEMKLTVQDFKDIVKLYSRELHRSQLDEYGFPLVPPGAAEFIDWRVPGNEEPYLTIFGDIRRESDDTGGQANKRLILRMSPKKYRFICDDPEPRKPKKGDWFMPDQRAPYNTGTKQIFIRAIADFTTHEHMIFRREEIE